MAKPTPPTASASRTTVQPITARVTPVDNFFSQTPPSGLQQSLILVTLSGIQAEDILEVAPDPERMALWVATKDRTGNEPTGLRLLVQRDSTTLTEATTPYAESRITHVAARPGKAFKGGRQLVIVNGNDSSLFLADQPATVVKLPVGTVKTAFSNDGTLLAYAKRTGEVGVFRLNDSSGRGGQNVGLTQIMAEVKVRPQQAKGWSLAFDSTGAYLYFVMVTETHVTETKSVMSGHMGWLDVKTKSLRFMEPMYKDSLPDWAFAVATPFNPQAAEIACFAGMSKSCHMAKVGNPMPRCVQNAPSTRVVRGIHYEASTLVLLHSGGALWAFDPTHSSDERESLVGQMPGDGPGVRCYHHAGCYTNQDGTRTMYAVASQPKPLPSRDDCGGEQKGNK